MTEGIIKGLKCPLCDAEAVSVLKRHLYNAPQLGLKWFYCSNCDKDFCKDKYTGDWKVASYDADPPEEEEESE